MKKDDYIRKSDVIYWFEVIGIIIFICLILYMTYGIGNNMGYDRCISDAIYR